MHLDILIDASGSMGFMKGAGVEHENKYLIDDGNTRTDLVKAILINHIVPKIDFCNSISAFRFRNFKTLDTNGNPVVKDNKSVEYPSNIKFYSGKYDREFLLRKIAEIKNPEPGGTPLRWSLLNRVCKTIAPKSNIIVFTDGDGYLDSQIDEDWHTVVYNKIIELKKDITIHIVGIAQSEIAQKKSKELCEKTKGVYLNLKSINYDASSLDSLLFKLKANITTQAIKDSLPTESAKTETEVIEQTPEVKEEIVKEVNPTKITLEQQVNRNTEALSLISNQLDNIIKLLEFKESADYEEIHEVFENEIHNKRVGRLAEKYLYEELKKNDWEEILWVNEDAEKYLEYDFKIRDKGIEYFYECKGTSGNNNVFLLTKKEWQFYLSNKGKYRVCFVTNIDSNPSYTKFKDLIEEMKEGKLIPCAPVDIKIKADRIIFQVV